MNRFLHEPSIRYHKTIQEHDVVIDNYTIRLFPNHNREQLSSMFFTRLLKKPNINEEVTLNRQKHEEMINYKIIARIKTNKYRVISFRSYF